MTRSPLILVCDDEDQILRALELILRAAGFEVIATAKAEEALDAAALRRPDAAIIDLLLLDGSGIEVCRELRASSEMPILMLSVPGDEDRTVSALEAGADDYVTKPFAPRELIARLNAALRRVCSEPGEPLITVDGLEIDLATRSVRREGRDLQLTPTEYALLRVLIRNRGRLLTHKTLSGEVWGPRYPVDTKLLRTHIANLRRKIEPEAGPRYIGTDSAIGYRFAG